MAASNKGRSLWLLFFAVFGLVMGVMAFAGARRAAAHHTVIFLPDDIGGVGDTWMWPGQAYTLSVFCLAFSVYVFVILLRGRGK
jgi:hypothetical protein